MRYIEVWKVSDLDQNTVPPSHSISEGELKESDVMAWVNREPEPALSPPGLLLQRKEVCCQIQQQHILRLLLCPSPPDDNDPDASFLPALGLPHNKLRAIIDAWKLPSLFTLAASREMSVAYTKMPMGSVANPSVSGLVLRNNHGGHHLFCLAVSYHRSTQTTLALIVGLSDECAQQIQCQLKSDLTSDSSVTNPLYLPIMLVEDSMLILNDSLREFRDRVSIVEHDTGMHYRHKGSDQPNQSLEQNLNNVTRELTLLLGAIAHVELICKSQLRFLDKFSEWLVTGLLPNVTDVSTYSLSWDLMKEKVEFMKSNIVCSLAASEYTHKLIEAQIRTVYSMLEQRDNRLALQNATVMRQMAQDSQEATVYTQQDSTDMRIIATVTLVFLPGTFTAALFSTPFFNFQAESDRKIASTWIWLYAVVTLCLTIAALAVWFIWVRVQNRKAAKGRNAKVFS